MNLARRRRATTDRVPHRLDDEASAPVGDERLIADLGYQSGMRALGGSDEQTVAQRLDDRAGIGKFGLGSIDQSSHRTPPAARTKAANNR